ncbi:2-iminoacetate synthase ThiH [Hathewaya massiliensis]|uniref:2-iminoacetate synthase ThiH n=1 Tax=Hathewaya massiliensis TaxID=1964382 RepID=UPI00115BE119|nr:2-iminoacetate synthase ThiH [Hathewaya massiliensis]
MSFYNTIKEFKDFDFNRYWGNVELDDVLRSINERTPSYEDLLNLLSPKAEEALEEMAVKARELSLKHFGRTVLLYTPIYIANYCINKCAYCGYNHENSICRKKLTMEEIKMESEAVSKEGFKHIILLTGESPVHSPTDYIVEAIKIMREYFPSITLEVQPLSEEDYKKAVEAGADGLTVYQEAYDEEVYDRVHLAGPKKNYKFRLDAPERGARAGMRSLSIGALLGLSDFRKDAFFTALHGEYLRKKYPHVDVTYSVPRIRPCAGGLRELNTVDDKRTVQIMLAYKIFAEQSGINISTREDHEMRRNLIPLGITKMSAGVSTEVGGHALNSKGTSQFTINDEGTVEEVRNMIIEAGFQPIFKDWERF